METRREERRGKERSGKERKGEDCEERRGSAVVLFLLSKLWGEKVQSSTIL